jgi:hypothetical protein
MRAGQLVWDLRRIITVSSTDGRLRLKCLDQLRVDRMMFSRRLRNAYKSNVKSFNLVRNDCLLVPPVSGRRDLPAPGWQNAHVVGCFFLGSQGFTGQRFTFRVDGIKSGLQLDLTAEEAMEAAREAAVLAGLELVPAGNDTGFSCVYRKGSKYQAERSRCLASRCTSAASRRLKKRPCMSRGTRRKKEEAEMPRRRHEA